MVPTPSPISAAIRFQPGRIKNKIFLGKLDGELWASKPHNLAALIKRGFWANG